MLIWMCALHCEAKPVIDFFRLKKAADKTEFDLYKNENMMCVVTGMGADKMSRAVNWAYSQCKQQQQICWINLGIAGHKHFHLGAPVLASQVSQLDEDKKFNLPPPVSHQFKTEKIISVSEETTEYDESALFDMEAYAFMSSASPLTTPELCQVIKVISDNQQTSPDRNKARISMLIANNMDSIATFAQHFLSQHT